ncbi:MAG: hypothetical protein ACK45B_06465 [Limisphaerales bacterium]
MKLFTALIALPVLAAVAAVTNPFPAHWGEPPKIQTLDYRELPGGYGHGSSTLANWISVNLAKDAAATNQPGAPALFACDFEALAEGRLPDSFMVLNGEFTVKDTGTNKVLELPGAPLDSYAVLFGPVTNANVSVTARVFGTAKGRRQPTFGVGLGGAAGYKLQVSPGKQALELILGETQVVTSSPHRWTAGEWTWLKLRVRAIGENQWRVEGKVWPDGQPEPIAWLLSHETSKPPIAGQASVLGSPFAGTPVWFDDLRVEGVRDP